MTVSGKDLQQLFLNARSALQTIETDKQKIIRKLAHDLQWIYNVPANMICDMICEELRGYCSNSYIKSCLDSIYKDVKKIRNNVTVECDTTGANDEKIPLEVTSASDGGEVSSPAPVPAPAVISKAESKPKPKPELEPIKEPEPLDYDDKRIMKQFYESIQTRTGKYPYEAEYKIKELVENLREEHRENAWLLYENTMLKGQIKEREEEISRLKKHIDRLNDSLTKTKQRNDYQ